VTLAVLSLKLKTETTAFQTAKYASPKNEGFLTATFIPKPIHLLQHPKDEAHVLLS
jgi:hypothetical protein